MKPKSLLSAWAIYSDETVEAASELLENPVFTTLYQLHHNTAAEGEVWLRLYLATHRIITQEFLGGICLKGLRECDKHSTYGIDGVAALLKDSPHAPLIVSEFQTKFRQFRKLVLEDAESNKVTRFLQSVEGPVTMHDIKPEQVYWQIQRLRERIAPN